MPFCSLRAIWPIQRLYTECCGGQGSLSRCGASFHAAEVIYAEMQYEKQTCSCGQTQHPVINMLQELFAYIAICCAICIKLQQTVFSLIHVSPEVCYMALQSNFTFKYLCLKNSSMKIWHVSQHETSTNKISVSIVILRLFVHTAVITGPRQT